MAYDHAEYQKAYSDARQKDIVAKFETAFGIREDISDSLNIEIVKATETYTFRLRQRGLDWARQLPDDLLDEIIGHGLKSVVALAKTRAKYGKNGLAHDRARSKKTTERAQANRTKAKLLDRVVEALDTRRVGDKQLGDATRADLLREAYRLDEVAAEATLDGALYRELAALIGDQTVRAFAGRGQVVALLTSRWKEEG